MKSDRECTSCKYLRSLYDKDWAQELKRYVDTIPDHIKADDATYETRLAICVECNDCREGICRYCGCFVAARAAKVSLACPKPGEARW